MQSKLGWGKNGGRKIMFDLKYLSLNSGKFTVLCLEI